MGLQVQEEFSCGVCGETFASRNKLFKHLELLGHHNEDDPDVGESRVPSTVFVRDNADFFTYYRLQGVAGADKDWEANYELFKQDLPVRFRITANGSSLGPDLGPAVVQRFLDQTGIPVEKAPYYCNNASHRCLLFSCLADPAGLNALQDLGLIQRQDQSSALPALLLDVRHGHCVVDLCAAPGSKTLQILDQMTVDAGIKMASGLLIANDTSRDRANIIAIRARTQPRHGLLVTCSDARFYPTVRRRKGFKMRFDRVLCDVPCSGDGTLRKDKSMRGSRGSGWKTWSVRDGLGLHGLQLKILRRGLELLGRGGRLLYSTCSLNPIEDEAVVAAVLAESSNTRLAPVPDELGLEFAPGLRTWRVPDHAFSCESPDLYQSPEDADSARKHAGGARKKLHATMFPPTRADVVEQLPLCARVLPVHGNGGGFFFAVFEKIGVEQPDCLDAECLSAALDADAPIVGVASGESPPERVEESAPSETNMPSNRDELAAAEVAVMEEGISQETQSPIGEYCAGDVGATDLQPAPLPDKKDKAPPPELRKMLRPASPSVVDVLVSEFGLERPCEDHTSCETTNKLFPTSSLFVRGESLILGSETMAKIWCTVKSMQVVEAGQYLFSGVRHDFAQWRIYPEAAPVLGRFARRRCFPVVPEVLHELLQACHGGGGVPIERLAPLDAASDGTLHGAAILALLLPATFNGEVDESSAASGYDGVGTPRKKVAGYVAADINVDGVLRIVDGAMILAQRWSTLFSHL